MAEHKEYPRFTGAQRVEHWIMFASFTVLAITGLPQKFAGDQWAETMIAVMGGIELVRWAHHIAAAVMTLGAVYHVIAIAYKVFVLRVRWSIFPRLDDVLDALDVIRYNLGLTKEHPKFDRFNFGDKFEYWAFVWGTLLMAFTGYVMWNPINAARFMPGDLIPAAKTAHGGEAILAVLAILVWHFYNVHLKTFNKAMFTGKISEHEMIEEHGLELERINRGIPDPRPAPEIVKQRERGFIPVAAVFAIVMLVGVYLFTSYEQTAITTLPKRATVRAFAPITLTPTPRAGSAPATGISAVKPMPADHTGRNTCLACHANIPKPVMPEDHKGRGDTTCTACHKTATAPSPAAPAGATPAAKPSTAPASGGTGIAKPLPATHEGRTTCNMCHETGVAGPKNPADHAGRTDATCVACHKPGAAPAPAGATPAAKPITTTSPAASTPVAKPTTASGATIAPASAGGVAKPQPATHAGRPTCQMCHETGVAGPKNPADHAGRTDAMCVACHKAP